MADSTDDDSGICLNVDLCLCIKSLKTTNNIRVRCSHEKFKHCTTTHSALYHERNICSASSAIRNIPFGRLRRKQNCIILLLPTPKRKSIHFTILLSISNRLFDSSSYLFHGRAWFSSIPILFSARFFLDIFGTVFSVFSVCVCVYGSVIVAGGDGGSSVCLCLLFLDSENLFFAVITMMRYR